MWKVFEALNKHLIDCWISFYFMGIYCL